MSESKKDKKAGLTGSIRRWFKSLKLEFKKIIWPGKKELAKKTFVVLVTAICLGLVIAGINVCIQEGIQFLMNIQF